MKSETKKFHKGNGWNFQVTYNTDAQLTYLNRYHTNGHQNSPDASKVFLQRMRQDWQDVKKELINQF